MATELGDGVNFQIQAGTLDVVAEPYLDLRETAYSVSMAHFAGNPQPGDRATLDRLIPSSS